MVKTIYWCRLISQEGLLGKVDEGSFVHILRETALSFRSLIEGSTIISGVGQLESQLLGGYGTLKER